MDKSQENLKTIWFEGEMLPNWAQLLDAAARMCPVTEGTRGWFSRFTNSSGVDDARTVVAETKILRDALRDNRQAIIADLQRTRGDGQAAQVFAARPKAVMMENVPRLGEKKVFREFTTALESVGYRVQWEIVDVQDFGVPQRRRRLVLIAGRRLDVSFPRPARTHRTVRQAIENLPPAGKSGDPLHDLPELRSVEVRRKIAKIPKDGGIYGRMAWDDVAPTITGVSTRPRAGSCIR